MKTFLTRVILFLITFSVLFIVTGFLYMRTYIKEVNSGEAFKLPDSIKTTFFGDSHALTSFNPEIIPLSFNASKNSESYFQTHYKIVSILNSNPQIKNVVLTYSYHNIAITQNENILYGDIYYVLLDNEGKNIIRSAGNGELLKFKYGQSENYFKKIKCKLSHFTISTLLWFKYDVGLPLDASKYLDFFITQLENDPQLCLHPLFQEIYKSTSSNLVSDVINNSIARHFYYRNTFNASDIMIKSLFKIAELCHNKKVNFILINTPLHSLYKTIIPEYYFHLHANVLLDLKNQFDNVYYYDFTSVNYPDSLFGDGDHLNAFGMTRFSEKIKDLFDEHSN